MVVWCLLALFWSLSDGYQGQQETNKKMVETRAQHRRRVASLTWNKVESNQDVFQDVLSRLPVRSIRSFKTVNRYWHASVSNKHFATIHLAQSRKKPSYIACPRVNNAMELYLLKPGEFDFRHHATVDPPGRNAEHHMLMIASFNGLVCCINQLSDENEEDYQIWICNPATEQTLLLPQGRPSFWTEPSIGVAYGPDMSDEYKIFRIFCVGKRNAGKGDYLYECEVYSSSSGAWRGIGPVLHLPMYVCFSPHRSAHVFAGGKIYWLVSLEDPAGIMLSVDMEENFEVMELPYYSTDLRYEDRITAATYLINLGGSPSLVVLHADYFDVWEWKEASWVFVIADEFDFMDFAEIVLFMTSPPTRFTNPAIFPFTESLLPCNGGVRLAGK
ncbi:BnaC05g32250D [Brassica napus]|uniref:BnaC05g32250D protein n=1 Tax=Brassica napus TaxID=3708 RepID=A0A078GSH1_BRANA|nr:BnaC05g32250D [Brassica napus]